MYLETLPFWLNKEFLGTEDSLHQKSPQWSSKVQFITNSKIKLQFRFKRSTVNFNFENVLFNVNCLQKSTAINKRFIFEILPMPLQPDIA